MSFSIGRLRKRATIQRRGTQVDEFGHTLDSWTDLATVFSSLEPLRGKEAVNAQQIKAEVTHKITMRYRELLPTDRLIIEGRTFNPFVIRNINEVNHWLEILAIEIV